MLGAASAAYKVASGVHHHTREVVDPLRPDRRDPEGPADGCAALQLTQHQEEKQPRSANPPCAGGSSSATFAALNQRIALRYAMTGMQASETYLGHHLNSPAAPTPSFAGRRRTHDPPSQPRPTPSREEPRHPSPRRHGRYQ
jgi:hypothetical protein